MQRLVYGMKMMSKNRKAFMIGSGIGSLAAGTPVCNTVRLAPLCQQSEIHLASVSGSVNYGVKS